MQIRVEQPFSLYADVDVTYDGRAASTLERGNYLIVHKSDGTLLVMGGDKYKPRNYQAPGAILKLHNNQLVSTRKDERINIILHNIISYTEHHDWSVARTKVTKTEAELRDKIAASIKDYIPNAIEVFVEFQTPVGNVDILVIDANNVYCVIEVKRGRASLAACSQIRRYTEYFNEIGRQVKGYIASPQISKNALKHAGGHNIAWLKADHSI
jgi:RecB family endonuclease NucS